MRSASTVAALDRAKIGETEFLMKNAELVQLVEKKGKRAGVIAPISCRPRNRLDGLKRKILTKAAC
jgi:hypothetical protein